MTETDAPVPAVVLAGVLRMRPDEISAGTAMRTTPAWDSLSHMDLVVAVETTYGVRLSMDDIAAMTSFDSLCEVLRSHGLTVP